MNIKLGVYYGYFAQSEPLPWEEFLERAHKAGADGIELSALLMQDVPKNRRDRIKGLIKEYGMFLTFATALKPDGDVSSDDPKERERGLKELKKQVLLAEEMGAERICGIIYGLGKNMPQGIAFSREHYLENAAKVLKTAGDFAYNHGTMLAVEAVNRFESPLLNTVKEGINFVTGIDSKGVGLHIDTFHMSIEEDDICAAIRTAKNHICHVHFSENNRKVPGGARLPWSEILRSFHEIEYCGRIVIESLAKPYGSFSDRLNIWRDLTSTGIDEDLRNSIRFLKGQANLINR